MTRRKVQPPDPRPWLRPRRGESEAQRQTRLMASCAGCGHYDPDPVTLLAHETDCLAQGQRTDLEEKR